MRLHIKVIEWSDYPYKIHWKTTISYIEWNELRKWCIDTFGEPAKDEDCMIDPTKEHNNRWLSYYTADIAFKNLEDAQWYIMRWT